MKKKKQDPWKVVIPTETGLRGLKRRIFRNACHEKGAGLVPGWTRSVSHVGACRARVRHAAVLMRSTLLLPLCALAAWACAADQVPVVPAGADKRFELALDPRTKIQNLKPVQVAQFRQRVDGLVSYLRTLGAVTEPPPPLCMRLSSWIEMGLGRNGMAQAVLDTHLPIGFTNGKCHRMTGTGVGYAINHDSVLFLNDFAHANSSDDEHRYYVLPIESQQGRITRFNDRSIILTRGEILPWRQVPRQRYLQQVVPRMEAEMAKLEQVDEALRELAIRQGRKLHAPSAAELRSRQQRRDLLARMKRELASGEAARSMAPVCIDLTGQLAEGGCKADRMLVEPNPDYWKGLAPDRIALIVISTIKRQVMQESNEKYAARMRIYNSLDLERIVTMLDN
ncbi:hypothetical protein D3870_18995 [Noviherbaspirillum cavernae]|uniref:Uncharacterized protein n=1 Tax=Noviherbaspirillum cavernae TaxID=2320862 RepID=A0A418WV07_9BURK|nr:hypothetical protein [Noviherbaspirillum cavernae]RJF96535.1 hypothetical protein D3870_18995 [Noviherbaspirillum cavernae]